MSQQYSVTDEEFDLAVAAIHAWHKERGVGFAIANTSSLLVAYQGNPLAVEAALRHSYEMVHGETAVKIMQRRQAMEQLDAQGGDSTDPEQVRMVENAIAQAEANA